MRQRRLSLGEPRLLPDGWHVRPTRPILPTIPFSTRIRSHTSRGVFYEVSLSGPTCTYPDFRSFRHRLHEDI